MKRQLTDQQQKACDRHPDYKAYVEANADHYVGRRVAMAYLLFSVANSYVEEANDRMSEYNLMWKKFKTKCNNLMQSFDAYDKMMREVLRDEDNDNGIGLHLCMDFDTLRGMCDTYMNSEDVQPQEGQTEEGQNESMLNETVKDDHKTKTHVDLGLPSGTLWATENENGYHTFEEADSSFGDSLPTPDQWRELIKHCKWEWETDDVYANGYKVTGLNGNSIFLPAAGYRDCNGRVYYAGSNGYYWSSTPEDSDFAWYLHFYSGSVYMYDSYRRDGISVRLVKTV